MKPRAVLAHTYSIVARDAESGALGVAVQSHYFGVGMLVPWARAGVGAVATQSFVEASYGPRGLEHMAAGTSATEALAALVAADAGRDVRQVGMVDAQGRAAAHTGTRCIAEAGHLVGDGWSVQANMMERATVWGAMAEAYRTAGGDFAGRLLAALDAAEAQGGDIRGKQAAAMLVVDGARQAEPWQGVLLELRVEDHPLPLNELRRLLRLQRAYALNTRGDDLLGAGDLRAAHAAYAQAAALAPEIAELAFWQAVMLAETGEVDQARPIFARVFAEDARWQKLLARLVPAGILSAEALTAITNG